MGAWKSLREPHFKGIPMRKGRLTSRVKSSRLTSLLNSSSSKLLDCTLLIWCLTLDDYTFCLLGCSGPNEEVWL